VNFKSHARTYVVINALVWGFWFFFHGKDGHYDGYWPIYMTLGWGFGLFSHYMGVYRDNRNAIEKEYTKLKKERGLD